MGMLALWADKEGRTLYRYGGEKAYNGNLTNMENRHLWKFSPDGAGGGTWSIQAPLDRQFFDDLKQGTRGASAFCKGLGVYAGGFRDRSTDWAYEHVTWPNSVPIPGMLTYNAATRAWTNETIPDNSNDSSAHAKAGKFTNGQAVCVTGFGPNPMVMMLGGWDADLQTIAMYDLITKRWFWQQTAGSVPRSRGNYCAVGVKGPHGTLEM
ncbi:hypothetical protein CDD83_3473 [Cordyceps sp. RAO-2017]|nr:hypothetical protein CDD83_3473 [Cordyceps sp. RAO-2017]